MAKKTQEEFENQIFEKYGDEYTVLGTYVNSDTAIELRHNVCGKTIKTYPYRILKKRICSKCNKYNTITHDEFIKLVFDMWGSEYIVLNKYINKKSKIKLRHAICGKEFEVRAGSFLKGAKCTCLHNSTRKTTKQFKEEIFKLVGDEFEVMEEYINAKTRILLKHNICLEEFRVSPDNFLKRHTCPICNGTLKKSEAEYKYRMIKELGKEYTVLGEYVNAKTGVEVIHNKCGHVYNAVPYSVHIGRGKCPVCFRCGKKDTDAFKKQVSILTNNDYVVMSDYKTAHEKIFIRHNLCGKVYPVTPDAFLRGNRCPTCSRKEAIKRRTMTTDEYKNKLYLLKGDEYSLLSEYESYNKYVRVKHNTCGYEYDVHASSLLRGHGCIKCFGKEKMTDKDFRERLHNLVGDEYEALEEYTGITTKLLIKHNTCGHEYHVSPNGFLNNNNRCPRCSSSKGEKEIELLLRKFNISFTPQFTFDDCIYKRPLRFDFAIHDSEGDIAFLCEFDGVQHFKPFDFFGGTESFIDLKTKDYIKEKYCRDNDISLIRIPYYNQDIIHKILIKKLHRCNLL